MFTSLAKASMFPSNVLQTQGGLEKIALHCWFLLRCEGMIYDQL
jgi:hypothetical protein